MKIMTNFQNMGSVVKLFTAACCMTLRASPHSLLHSRVVEKARIFRVNLAMCRDAFIYAVSYYPRPVFISATSYPHNA